MTLRLHPELIAAGYEYIRQSVPRWKLPEAEEIGFAVVKDASMFADFCLLNGVPLIRVSENMHGHTNTLLSTIAHECIHLYQHLNGLDLKGGEHNPDFYRRAKRMCALHGFDEKVF